MRRNLLLLNAALLALVCLLGWYVRQSWLREQAHERAVRIARVRPLAVPPPPALKKIAPLDGPSYADVATRNLFSADRNPTPIPDPPPPPPPPKPMPALPSAHGVMLWGGLPPTVVLSEHGKAEQKAYHPGDKIGEFTIVSVNNREIVFDWEGNQIAKRLDEMMEKDLMAGNNASQGGGGAGSSPAAQPPKSASLSEPATNLSASANGPGKEVGGGIHQCVAGDSSAPGTVVDGLEKKVNTTPFGVTCRWEPVK